jgi:hypothetical protein
MATTEISLIPGKTFTYGTAPFGRFPFHEHRVEEGLSDRTAVLADFDLGV